MITYWTIELWQRKSMKRHYSRTRNGGKVRSCALTKRGSKNITWKIRESTKSPENQRKIERLLLIRGAGNPVIIIDVTDIVFSHRYSKWLIISTARSPLVFIVTGTVHVIDTNNHLIIRFMGGTKAPEAQQERGCDGSSAVHPLVSKEAIVSVVDSHIRRQSRQSVSECNSHVSQNYRHHCNSSRVIPRFAMLLS